MHRRRTKKTRTGIEKKGARRRKRKLLKTARLQRREIGIGKEGEGFGGQYA